MIHFGAIDSEFWAPLHKIMVTLRLMVTLQSVVTIIDFLALEQRCYGSYH